MRRFFLVLMFLVIMIGAHAQTSTTAGAWTTGSNWSTGTAPNTGSLSTNVIINKAMTFNSGSITGWGSTTITITTGGSLTVTGNFTLTGSGVNITVQSGGSLSVSGTTTITNGARVTIAGGGTPGSASFAALSATSNGQITINSGATVTATSVTTSSNSDAIVNNAGTLNVNGSVSSSGVITNSGTMNVTGNYTQQNTGNSTTNSGQLNVSGNASANGLIQLNPGSSTDSNMIVNGTLTVNANPWIIVGTNVSGCSNVITRYANLVVKSDLILTGSGDVTVNQTGRLAVFGDITRPSGGGSLITINCGGQAYVAGDINIGTGGGNNVTNSNGSGSPTGTDGNPVIGLYVGGSTTAQTITGTVGTESQLQSNDLPFYTWIGTIPGSPLPVELIYFKIKGISSTGVALIWATSMEKNFSHFSIERASSDLVFSTIGRIDGKGGESVKTIYSFEDEVPTNGKNYYRLKCVDLDGTFEYSIVIVATWDEQSGDLIIYPNPIINHSFTLELNDVVSIPTSLILCNIHGHVVFQTSVEATTTEIALPENITPGVYLAKVGSQVMRVVVK